MSTFDDKQKGNSVQQEVPRQTEQESLGSLGVTQRELREEALRPTEGVPRNAEPDRATETVALIPGVLELSKEALQNDPILAEYYESGRLTPQKFSPGKEYPLAIEVRAAEVEKALITAYGSEVAAWFNEAFGYGNRFLHSIIAQMSDLSILPEGQLALMTLSGSILPRIALGMHQTPSPQPLSQGGIKEDALVLDCIRFTILMSDAEDGVLSSTLEGRGTAEMEGDLDDFSARINAFAREHPNFASMFHQAALFGHLLELQGYQVTTGPLLQQGLNDISTRVQPGDIIFSIYIDDSSLPYPQTQSSLVRYYANLVVQEVERLIKEEGLSPEEALTRQSLGDIDDDVQQRIFQESSRLLGERMGYDIDAPMVSAIRDSQAGAPVGYFYKVRAPWHVFKVVGHNEQGQPLVMQIDGAQPKVPGRVAPIGQAVFVGDQYGILRKSP